MSNMSPDRDVKSQQKIYDHFLDSRQKLSVLANLFIVFAISDAKCVNQHFQHECRPRHRVSADDLARNRRSSPNPSRELHIASSSGTVGWCHHRPAQGTNFEVTEIEEVSDTSPQVLVDVHNVGTDESAFGSDTAVSDADRQRKRISQIVKAKDLQSLNDFGGFEGIAVALNTDLEKGIRGDEKDILSRRNMGALFKAQDPAQGLFQLLLKSCNYYIIALLGLSAALSIAFGINMEGLSTGWYQGAIIILATGDTMSRADGLFISGEFLKMDNGLAAINELNPFLFYGAKVVKGHGRMLVFHKVRQTLP
ncbi:hypothetical protein Patl1_09688 [Pistacia atlantica]|uniref:Uncharacterized protein n=1 Tax=Pistacia atlantica TaxID=434234 RepID=A0ACC1A5Y4_9ROSI|nr:hypothetical protein Patl1_09688 [Pistacia atlantica]